MVLFACDWCRQIKKDGEEWILGLAAESIGITAARREVSILPAWNDAQACHPLAVHFCSVEDKDKYLTALFETEPQPVESSVKIKTASGKRTAEREFLRTTSTGPIAAGKKVRARGKLRKSA